MTFAYNGGKAVYGGASGADVGRSGVVEIGMSAEGILTALMLAAAGLVAAHITLQFAVFLELRSPQSNIVRLFNLDEEANFPTLFTGLLMLCSAGLAWLIGRSNPGEAAWQRKYWFGLTAAFIFLSFDEMMRLHEMLISLVRSALHTGGIFYFAWVIPYGILTIVFVAAYSRFLFNLNSWLRNAMIVSGAVYVSGALGLELLGGALFESAGGTDNLAYVVMTTIEESLEMVGLILFIHALALQIETRRYDMRLTFRPGLAG